MDVDQVLAKLTIPQKIKLLAGFGWWHTHAIPEAGVPSMRMSDGPNGARGQRCPVFSVFFNGVPASCFPASTGLGSSFDVDLAQKVGHALANEARAKGAHILLAPTVNTQRSPLGGRGFESFSEDPNLNGTIAAAYINGLQSNGVSATIKHYVANDQEFERFSISSDVSERALREIYLKPFQIAIRDSNPWALMTAYNRVNGIHVSEDKRLVDDILRKEWGYKGLVMSDWTGVYSTTESIKAGVDLEMPGPSVMRGKAVERALMCGKLFPSDIDARARKILELLKHAQDSGIPFDAPEESIDTPELRQLLRTAAADAIVLLKNDKHLLPLPKDVKKIAVIGPNAKLAHTSGGGSARLLSTYAASPLEGITAVANEIGAEVKYTIGAVTHTFLPLLDPCLQQKSGGDAGAVLEFWNQKPSENFLQLDANVNTKLEECNWSTTTLGSNCILFDGIDATKVNYDCFIRYSAAFIPDEDEATSSSTMNSLSTLQPTPNKARAFFGLATIDKRSVVKGLKAGQSYNLEVRISTSTFVPLSPLPAWGGLRIGGCRKFDGEEGIKDAVALAKESDVVILVVGLNHDWEIYHSCRTPLVSAVLSANPNTVVVNQSGTPVAMPWIQEASTVLQAFYGGNELGNGLADVLWGKVNPSAKISLTFPKRLEDAPSFSSFGNKGQEHGKILYNEGIFVGYRNYEHSNIQPLFPFGFGLSYSTFEYSDLETSSVSSEGAFSVTFKIKNTSNVPGREVVQVYISDPQSSLPRPPKELKGFVKVALNGGESKSVKVDLTREALGFYDDRQSCWLAEKGTFGVHVAASSADVRLKGEVELGATLTWTGL
ncbi:Beta-glucosidase [Mycena sanguinolenta]|uniref:beta-glucosidase n=1 Tax=Mycena sanguinolenta TaxID=230812 RepID=A0A8H6YBY8_9AGAR|nr:Beta-glucosidase [Mycena sanguinolenta]